MTLLAVIVDHSKHEFITGAHIASLSTACDLDYKIVFQLFPSRWQH